MKEITIADVSYWKSNIQNIKKIPSTCLNAISDVTRGQIGTHKVYIPFYFIKNT